jgi:CubicO group peptidase (beta-lactamase class C family)
MPPINHRTGHDRREFLKLFGLAAGSMGLIDRGSPSRADDAASRREFETADLHDVTAFLDAELQAGTFPGAGLTVRWRGQTILERSWGTYCGRERRAIPLDSSVVHMLFSASKLISATVVLIVGQDGSLDLDAPVAKYIPQFTGGGKDRITIRHLLTHSAGIPAVPLGPVDTAERWAKAVELVCAAKADWPPGSRTLYHGLSGLFVAAEAVRRVSRNKPWNTICTERLFEPLGAKSLTFEMPSAKTPLALAPQPKELPARFGAMGEMALGHPAGGCFGTLADLAKVLALHLAKGVWKGKPLLHQRAYEAMHTVQYAAEIDKAVTAGRAPTHDSWGLGILLRGSGPATGVHSWFGFHDQKTPKVFGHAGIDTVLTVADSGRDVALVFATTDSPKPKDKTAPLRNGVTNRVFAAVR